MNKPDGGAAFPALDSMYQQPGMTLRDWFAGQAIAGIFAQSDNVVDMDAQERASYAYYQADAMLAERDKPG